MGNHLPRNHAVLPATDTSERAPPNPSHTGWYSIIPTPEGWKAELT